MGHHTHHHRVVRTPPSQIAELERQRQLKLENERKMKQLAEEQQRRREEEEKRQKEKELEEIRKMEEEFKRKKKEEEERIIYWQNQAYYNFIEKCNSICNEKIHNLINSFPNDFTSQYLSEKIFISCFNYIKSIYYLSSNYFKLDEKLDNILNLFLQQELSKIKINNTKLNILVIGPSGVGKSTLINEFLELDDQHKAKENDSDSCTMTNEYYESPKNPQFGLIDTRGIEKDLNQFGIEKMIENIKEDILNRNKISYNDQNKFIHGIWYCMDSSRFEDSEINCLLELSNIYGNSGLPIIIVFTQSINKYKAEAIEKKIKSLNNGFQFVRVLARDKMIDDEIIIRKKGLDNLQEITLKKCSATYLPAYIKYIEDKIKNRIYLIISKIKGLKNWRKNKIIYQENLMQLIKNEIVNLSLTLGLPIRTIQINFEIENEIYNFLNTFSQILKERFQNYEENNKKDLFNKMKELNAEMRNYDYYLVGGISKKTSDAIYQNNSNILNKKIENFEVEFILNYFIRKFVSFSSDNIKNSFLRIFYSNYYDKIKLNIEKMNYC